jgi:hypothetical protein
MAKNGARQPCRARAIGAHPVELLHPMQPFESADPSLEQGREFAFTGALHGAKHFGIRRGR